MLSILKSLDESAFSRLLSLKCQACHIASKRFLLIVCENTGVAIVGSVDQ
jgi:hypothetical protein